MDIQRTIDNLTAHGFEVKLFENKEDAAAYINSVIDNTTVGFGDSHTLQALKMHELLCTHNTLYDPVDGKDNDEFIEIGKKCLLTDVFLTSVNAISETGEMVNIDGTGNRVAGSLFGHKRVFFVAGTNKICPTLEDAIYRARNVAAPLDSHALGYDTPCAAKGDHCYDCRSAARICNAMAIYMNRMTDLDEAAVILINEELGF